jgi:uncharacterized protein (TIGR02594 family)
VAKFKLVESDLFFAIEFHTEPDETSSLVKDCPRIAGGSTVDTTGKTATMGDWIEVRHQTNVAKPFLLGWIQASFLGAPVAVGDPVVLAIEEGAFVAECVRFELSSQDDKTLGADYLIAWALLETALTDFGPHLHDKDAVGPFQITQLEWNEYLAADVNFAPGPDGRLSGYAQIDCAAWIGKRDVEGFLKAMGTGDVPIDNYVVSLLNAFHCRLIGVPGAVQVQRIQTAKAANPTMDSVLAPFFAGEALPNLFADRKRYLAKDPTGGFSTVDAFVNVTSAALAESMTKAFTLLKTHIPGFIPTIEDKSVAGGWMSVAEGELKAWSDGNLIESAGEGRDRVKKYFAAATKPHSPDEAWCGAFAAWCLQQAGEAAASSVIQDPEWAANWKNWGDLELRQRDWSGIPSGAVVVLAPAANTDSSGHVAFFRQTIRSGKVELLGGNQSDRVTAMVVERNKIVSIRWLSTLDVAPADTDRRPVAGAILGGSKRDQIILARTIYGEARGEQADGKAAVASVVLNRAKIGGWYGHSIEEVCLKRKQFSCWNANDPNRAIIKDMEAHEGDQTFDRCFDLSAQAILGQLDDKTGGATHFHADTMRRFPDWAKGATRTAHIGHHIFYKNA